MDQDTYIDAQRAQIKDTLEDLGSQPILFLGSGVTRRYLDGPDWRGLLRSMAYLCPTIDKDFAYFEQNAHSLSAVGQTFADLFFEWAWTNGKDQFPEEYFSTDYDKSIFLKNKVCELVDGLLKDTETGYSFGEYDEEVEKLRNIRPHAIVTTNYDKLAETIFPEYEPIIGQQILSGHPALMGEIFKIHGCVSDPSTIVLTDSDYKEFHEKKKYLSAKLLQFFLEHPVLIVGYSAEDPNVRAILSDIDIILSAEGALIENIYLLRRPREGLGDKAPPSEELIPVSEGRRVRIKTIVTDDFSWVFESFGTPGAMEKINPKLLRSLLARTYDLVRHDIPKSTVEVDYSFLERAASDENELAKLYGVTVLGDASDVNLEFPYTLTNVANEIGYPTWHKAHQLIEELRTRTGLNIKESDNRYHIKVKAGRSSYFHKYSPETVTILERVRDDPDYTPDLDV